MKVKLNFDKDAILGFFAHQSEKIVLGLVVLCFLMFVYRAIGRDRYDKTPDELIRAAQEAERKVEATQPVASSSESHYEPWVTSNNKDLELGPYRHATVWNPQPFPQRGKRGEPKLYTVQGLRGASGIAAVESQGERSRTTTTGGGGRDRRGMRWVVLTGLVPVADQAKAYDECFRDAVQIASTPGSQSDQPVYYFYRIERAKIDPHGKAGELKWEELKAYAALVKSEREWGMQGSEMVPNQYIDTKSKLTFPLPKLIGQEWDGSVAHEPEIPLASRGGGFTERMGPDESLERPGQPEGPLPELPMVDEREGGPSTRGRDMMGPGDGEPRRPSREVGMRGRGTASDVRHLLFRYVDSDVEPGASYCYRVRLMLLNPNHGLEDRYVQSPEVSQKQFLESEWTEPTGPIQVPRDDRLLVASVAPSRGVSGEPTSKILAVHWDMDLGTEMHEEFTVARGTLANFLDRKAATETKASVLGGLDRDRGRPFGARDDEEQRKVDYKTETLVLDLQGGERLPGRDREQTRPGELLLLGPDGSLVVAGELEDAAAVDRCKETEEKKAPPGGPKKAAGKAGGRQDELELLRGGPGGTPRRSTRNPRTSTDQRQPMRGGPEREQEFPHR